jgi:non-ribosomal peptide synthetase component E (peptide arylation enzyme)
LPPDAAKEIEERMGCIVTTLYGIIGGGIPTQTGIYDPPEKRYNTVGKPMPGMTVEIRDNQNNPVPQGASGEICFKGALLCAGFWDTELMKEHMDDQRFYHTGDLGMFDDEGYLHIVGRKKDMIIRGGQNIIPVEIENMILTHPKVADVAIVGMPDPVMGEKVCAFVVPKEGETFSFEEMIRHLEKEKTAKYKLPERLEIINELPLSAGGKVQKAKLKEDITVKLQEEMGDTK